MTKYPEIQAHEKLSDLRRLGCFYVACSEVALTPSEIQSGAAQELVIHNNLANLISSTDMNCMSAMQYAVEILQVENILICGHYGCKGVTTATEGCRLDFLGNWLHPVVRIADKYRYLLDKIIDKSERIDVLCKLNVIEQVLNTCRKSVVQEAWLRGQNLTVKGIIYDQQNGSFTDVTTPVEGDNSLIKAYDLSLLTLLNEDN